MRIRSMARTLVLAGASLGALAAGGCGGYGLYGKVVRGEVSDVELLYATDPRLDAQGIPNAEVLVHRDPDSLGRYVAGRDRTGTTGDFTILMDEFGAGWMQEEWLVQASKAGYQNAEMVMKLPAKSSKWRLLITLAPGAAAPVEAEDLMEDLERFR